MEAKSWVAIVPAILFSHTVSCNFVCENIIFIKTFDLNKEMVLHADTHKPCEKIHNESNSFIINRRA